MKVRKARMILIKNTPNLYGITVSGDYVDLTQLRDAIGRYLDFYYVSHDLPTTDEKYEYLMALNYDIRHAYMGTRLFDVIDNGSDVFISPPWYDKTYYNDNDDDDDDDDDEEEEIIYPQKFDDLMKKKSLAIRQYLSKKYEITEIDQRSEDYCLLCEPSINALGAGNLYFKVEILYPAFFYFILALRIILDAEPNGNQIKKYNHLEIDGHPGLDPYSLIEAQKDRALINFFCASAWPEMRELLGSDIVDSWDEILNTSLPLSVTPTLYVDVLLHAQMVYFPSMSEENRKDYLICSFTEIAILPRLASSRKKNPEYQSLLNSHLSRVSSLNKDLKTPVFPTYSFVFSSVNKYFSGNDVIYTDEFDDYLDKTFGKVTIEDPVM